MECIELADLTANRLISALFTEDSCMFHSAFSLFMFEGDGSKPNGLVVFKNWLSLFMWLRLALSCEVIKTLLNLFNFNICSVEFLNYFYGLSRIRFKIMKQFSWATYGVWYENNGLIKKIPASLSISSSFSVSSNAKLFRLSDMFFIMLLNFVPFYFY